jgi:Zn-dependent protease with chaperone function
MCPFTSTAYRYPNEHLVLLLTISITFIIIAITSTATVCISGVFVIGMVATSYYATRAHHQQLTQRALRVTPESAPGLEAITTRAAATLQTEPVEVYVAPSRQLNAYAFGLSQPKAIVLHAPLLQIMDPDELLFIVGHEMGHVHLGHTWLNSLLGGMAGIPAPSEAALLMVMIFRWWNRSCELSSDRAGLLVCRKPEKAISALVKMHAAELPRSASMEDILRHLDAQDDSALAVAGELLQTHPMAIRRINQIRQYAASVEYRRLAERMAANVEPG